MEEWHQKLHNNSSPDDVAICEALLAFIGSGGNIATYWKVLYAWGIDADLLRSYDRPICSEPDLQLAQSPDLKKDLTNYLKILKAVHCGYDLDAASERVSHPYTNKRGFNGLQ